MAPVRSHKPVRAVRFRLPQPCRSRPTERTLGFEPSNAGATPVSGSSLKGRSSENRTAGSYPACRGLNRSAPSRVCWPPRVGPSGDTAYSTAHRTPNGRRCQKADQRSLSNKPEKIGDSPLRAPFAPMTRVGCLDFRRRRSGPPLSFSAQPCSGRVAQQVERPVEARRHALVRLQPRPPSFAAGGWSNGKTPDCYSG